MVQEGFDSQYKKYIGNGRILYCKLLKALHGCLQASKLWYKKVRKLLHAQGYDTCEVDPFVLQYIVGDKVFILLLYADNILPFMEIHELE